MYVINGNKFLNQEIAELEVAAAIFAHGCHRCRLGI